MRTTSFAALVAAAFFIPTQEAEAQARFLPYVGYNTNAGYDFEETFEDGEAESAGGVIVGVGAEFGFPTGGVLALKLRPSVETVFVPGEGFEFELPDGTDVEAEFSQSFYQVSADLIAEFGGPGSSVTPYIGAGGTYVAYNAEGDGVVEGQASEAQADDDGFGGNILGGVRFGNGFIAPFAQVRYSIFSLDPQDESDEAFLGDDSAIDNALSFQVGLSLGL